MRLLFICILAVAGCLVLQSSKFYQSQALCVDVAITSTGVTTPTPTPSPTPSPTPTPKREIDTDKSAGPPSTALLRAKGREALAGGRSMLGRGNAEPSLIFLEKALKFYTEANDEKGIAATQDALGDLYSHQAQYAVAVNHYQAANKSFATAGDTYNANLMLAKIGDMFYSVGNNAEARAAYSQMTVPKIDNSTMGKVKQTLQKVEKTRDLVNKGREVMASGLSPETVGKATALDADVKMAIEQEREAYRQYIIYSIYELGMGRLDYTNNQLDSAKTHFSNALAAADNPFYGRFRQAQHWRVASRTSLGDIALQQGRYSDAIKFALGCATRHWQEQVANSCSGE